MLSRCVHYRHEEVYPHYVGIGVCDRWNPEAGGGFENFLEDLGERLASTSLGRFGDVGDTYCQTVRGKLMKSRKLMLVYGIIRDHAKLYGIGLNGLNSRLLR